MTLFDYTIEAQSGAARAARYETAHGDFTTPMFMPVGTHATVKGVTIAGLHELNAQVVLANTYHLYMRPGVDVVEEAGGVHRFMAYDGPMLTDSGGFQLFSLAHMMKPGDDGVKFRADDYDGSKHFWTPEINMDIQERIGADIVMQLDQCVGYPCERRALERATELSSLWAERCFKAHTREDQALFGIVQGGMDLKLRRRSLEHLESCGDFPGYGIGGYSVGEDHETMFESLAPLCEDHMPRMKPRYLMGVGNPTTLVRGVGHGIDMFDCVLPTRTARVGTAFSREGKLNMRNARFREDMGPLDEGCGCPACSQGFTRAYIHHLVRQHEMSASVLISMHNIFFLVDLMRQAREAILEGRYQQFIDEWMACPGAAEL